MKFQEKSGVRPIVQDLDEVSIALGFENVRVVTPKVETKHRSGEWGQIPMQIECFIPNTAFRINISFLEGYPKIPLIVYVLHRKDLSPKFNATENKFDIPECYDLELTSLLREKVAEFDGTKRYACDVVKFAQLEFVKNEAKEEENPSSVLALSEVLEAFHEEKEDVQEKATEQVSYRCKCCRSHLFTSVIVEKHINECKVKKCQNIFLSEAPSWMAVDVEGKILCPESRCQAKLGSWSWAGCACSCGFWVCPSFQFTQSKVDDIRLGSDMVPLG